MKNFEKLYPKIIHASVMPDHCSDFTLTDFEQIINTKFMQLKAKWLNDINYFSRESEKFGIVFLSFIKNLS